MPTQLSHLDVLEAESIHIIREVAAEFEKPVLLFSGGKDSAVMLRLAEKAFWPARIPFPVMHVDTGHNFGEVIAFRDRLVADGGLELLVGSVQASIDAGAYEQAIGQLLTAAERLIKIASADVSAQRVEAARLLQEAQARWYLAQPPQ